MSLVTIPTKSFTNLAACIRAKVLMTPGTNIVCSKNMRITSEPHQNHFNNQRLKAFLSSVTLYFITNLGYSLIVPNIVFSVNGIYSICIVIKENGFLIFEEFSDEKY